MNSGLMIEIVMGIIVLGLAGGAGWALWAREWGLAALAVTALGVVVAAIWFALNAWKP
ncbi:MAG: hypothetical protein U1E23_14645 [Reyranellaceae bacterium]